MADKISFTVEPAKHMSLECYCLDLSVLGYTGEDRRNLCTALQRVRSHTLIEKIKFRIQPPTASTGRS